MRQTHVQLCTGRGHRGLPRCMQWAAAQRCHKFPAKPGAPLSPPLLLLASPSIASFVPTERRGIHFDKMEGQESLGVAKFGGGGGGAAWEVEGLARVTAPGMPGCAPGLRVCAAHGI